MKRIKLLIPLFLLLIQNASAITRYVTVSGSGLQDGTSWSNAFSGPQFKAALDSATSGTDFWVAAGEYSPGSLRTQSFVMENGVNIYGGFAGTETLLSQRNVTGNLTVLSGDVNQNDTLDNVDNYHVVRCPTGVTNTTISGFTIEYGNANAPGGGVDDALGGGIYCEYFNASATVDHCIIQKNYANYGGGAIFAQSPVPLNVSNCKIQNNDGQYGGALFLNMVAFFKNCLIINNRGTNVIHCTQGGSLSFVNCTFSGNFSWYYGTFYFPYGAVDMTNCIFWNNNAYSGPVIDVGQSVSAVANYCDVQGGWPGSGANNLNIDPLFVNSNLELKPCSPLINAGTNTGAPSIDFGDYARPYNSITDIGAWEYQGNSSSPSVASVTIVSDTNNVCYGTQITFTATPTNGGMTPSYQWKVNGSNVGANSAVFASSTVKLGDVVTCDLMSGDPCAFPNPVTGNSIIVYADLMHTWYLDADSDFHAISTMQSCGNPGPGWSDIARPVNDCNDADPNVHGGGSVTITYLMKDANLTTGGYNIGCPANTKAYAPSLTGQSYGFTWTDKLPANATITNIQLETSFYLNCNNYNPRTVTLNDSVAGGIIPFNTTCSGCGSPAAVDSSNINGAFPYYVFGGTNTIRLIMNWPNFEGLIANPAWLSYDNVYARVKVTVTFPSASEICGNNIDEDCNGIADDFIPVASAAPATICIGSSTVLTTNGAATYSWSPAASLNNSTSASVTASPTQSTTYTVSVTTGAGCTGSKTVHVNVSTVTPTITSSNGTVLCSGSISLTANTGLSVDSNVYLWSNGATTKSISVNTPGTYTVTSNACPSNPFIITGVPGNTSSAGINVWNVYAFNAGGQTNTGTSWNTNYSGYYVDTVLNFNTENRWNNLASPSNASGYIGCPVAADNHSWSAKRKGFPCGYYSISIASHDDQGELFVNDSMVWQHVGCCDSHSNVWTGWLGDSSKVEFRVTEGVGGSVGSITFNTTPINLSVSGPTNICTGQSVTLTATSVSASYLWSTSETTNAITVNTSGTYVVTITGAGMNCSVTKSQQVTAYNATPPSPVITSNPGSTICDGYSTDLSTTSSYSSYQWSGGSTNVAYTVAQSGNYSVLVTDANGCTGVAPNYNVTVLNNPSLYITYNGSLTFCPGYSLNLISATSANSYLWSTGATTDQLTVNTANTYTITITQSNGCTRSASVSTVVAPLPPPLIYSFTNSMFCPINGYADVSAYGDPRYDSYLWSNGDPYDYTSFTAAGTYTVTVSDLSGCTASSSIVISGPPGNPSVYGNNLWNVYVWNAGSGTLEGTNNWNTDYSGYYVDNNLSFNTENYWSSYYTPSYATGYQGCFVNYDNHSWSAKRKGFPCGIYSIDVTDHDDAGQLFINGNKVWEAGCCGLVNNVWTGLLDSTTTIEFRVTDNTGYSNGVLTFNLVSTPAIAVSGPVNVCSGQSRKLTAPYGSSYLWSNGATTNPIYVFSSGNYSVTVTGTAGCSFNVPAVTVNFLPNAAPVASISATPDSVICDWNPITLTSGSASTYLWSTGVTTQSIPVTYAGLVSLTITNAVGCADSITKIIKAGFTPPAPSASNSGPLTCPALPVNLVAGGLAPGGQVASFNGINQYIKVTQDIPENNFTVEMWIKTTAFNTGIFSVTDNFGSHDRHLYLSNGQLWVRVWTGPGWNTNATINDGQWHHIALTVQTGVGQKVYIDGTLLPTTNAYDHSDFNTQTDFKIGFSEDALLKYFNGQIDNVRIWSEVRTQTQLRNNMMKEIPSSVTNLVYHANMNGNTNATTGNNGVTPNGISYSTPAYIKYTWTGANAPAPSTAQTQATGNLSASGNYSVTASVNGCSPSASASTSVTVAARPTVAITGAASSCLATPLTATAGFPAYQWSNGGTNQGISAGSTATYTVTVTNNVGCTNSATKAVVIGVGVPAQPGAISGPNAVCKNSTVIYSIAAVPHATGYTWTASNGATVSTGQGSTTVTVSISSTATNSSVSVIANSPCGSSAAQSLSYVVSSVIPAAPATINGNLWALCNQSSVAYNCPAVTNATSYLWTLPTGVTLLSGQGTNAITVKYTGSFTTTGTISVAAVSGCGSSAATSRTVNAKPPQPVISGQNWACKGQAGLVYSIAPVTGATSYTWTIVNGSTLVSGQGTTSITVNWGNVNGVIKCTASNGCGSSVVGQLAVSFTCKEAGTMEDFSELSLYPNPASSTATISFDGFAPGNGQLAVYDLIGQQVMKQDIEVTAGYNNYKLDLSGYAKGAYMVRVTYNGVSRNCKLIVE
ncbi:MAG: LamG-like jellyroll fold domain-containing protein [Bacteroidia bacterium]